MDNRKPIRAIVALGLFICTLFCTVSCSFEETPAPSSSEMDVVSSDLQPSMQENTEPFYITSLLENESVKKHLKERYPNITAWQSVYEYHDYQNELFDGNLQEGSAWYNAVAVISTTQSGVFDRVVVSVYGEFSLTQTEQERWTMTLLDGDHPLNKPYILSFKGREREWMLGKCENVEVVFDGSTFCTFWFKEKSEALFFTEPSAPLRSKGITQEPKVCHSYYEPYSEVAKIENCYVLRFEKDGGSYAEGEEEIALWRDGVITIFEGIEGTYPQQSVLGDQLIAWGTSTKVCLYDLSTENFGTPIMTLGGNGQGLANTEVDIKGQVFTDLAKTSRHCIMYYIKEEREWRICTFDNSGEILCNFSTGLAVIDDTITSVKLQKGLLYFSYRPDGALGKATHYCVDVRPNENHTPQRLD